MDLPRPPFGPSTGATRDPDFIRRVEPVLGALLDRWHEVTIEGVENAIDGRALAVGNHSGGIMAPDMFALMVHFWRRFGADKPTYGLMHDVMFRVPGVGPAMAKMGAVPADPRNAVALLEGGSSVLVYPGGDLDAFRPHARRNEIVFGRRTGFVKVALRARAPIVPVVTAGAHDCFHVLTDGTAFARAIGLKKLARVEVLPIALGLPWGVQIGPWGHLPWPVRMRIRVLPAIAWPDLGPDAADDPAIVARCRDEVVATMQRALDEMAREGGHGRRPLADVVRSIVG
jgi:1-acyl-sn-glycerol-3-phosphate acyltransferase